MALFAGSVAHAANPPVTPGDGEWLFVQQSSKASLRAVDSSKAFRLTLIHPDATVQAFTDRPVRKIALEPLAKFIGSWSTYGFKGTPPNAAIQVPGNGAGQDVLIGEISQPVLAKNGNVSFLVQPLRGKQRPADLRYFVRRADKKLPARLGPTTLFIDDAVDTTIPLRLNFASGIGWLGYFQTSAATLASFSTTGASTFTPTRVGSGFSIASNANVTGYADLNVNPQGDCIFLQAATLLGPSPTLSAQAATGPQVTVANGITKVPTSPQANCG